MNNYVICTDSSCDLSQEILQDWGVECLSMKFRFEDEEKEYSNYEMDTKSFYDKMRDGAVAKTAALNIDDFTQVFDRILNGGKDVLYLAFSSGLSTTCNSARIAADELKENYPDRKIIVIDTLAASAGLGLLVYFAVQKQKDGANIDENEKYIKQLVSKLCHWFTVDDLVYLKRGGRISPTVAFVGTVLGIKPVLDVDETGHLVSREKARGRKAALNMLADKYELSAEVLNGNEIFISHADCIDDAKALALTLNARFGATVKSISNIGPVIGAHSGPGTVALFFIKK